MTRAEYLGHRMIGGNLIPMFRVSRGTGAPIPVPTQGPTRGRKSSAPPINELAG